MVNLTRDEGASIFSYLNPGCQNGRRRAATYRGGDNVTALSVNLDKGLWCDHVTGQGGDVVQFVRVALSLNFLDACQWISDFVGRPVLSNDDQWERRPRFTRKQLSDAELFQTGFLWKLEEHLKILKQNIDWDTPAVSGVKLFQRTAFASQVKGWDRVHAAHFVAEFRKSNSKFVRQCIADAFEFQQQVAWLIAACEAANKDGVPKAA